LLSEDQTSWVGTILLIFSALVTVVVAIYLYKSFRDFKRRQNRVSIVSLEEGDTEVGIEPGPRFDKGKLDEQEGLGRRTSDDDFLFDDEDV
jgi:hypothetical protein